MNRQALFRKQLLFILMLITALTISVLPVAAQENVLTFGLSFTVDTLDPGATTFSGVEIIDGHVFDTLVTQQPLGEFQPGLATEWSVNDDATEYTFSLRDDVTFHDGTPFNAEAVKFTFDRIVDPDLQSQMAISFIGPYQETEVVDDYTVIVRFSSPNAAFLDGLSHPQLGPVSPTAVEELGEDWGFSGIVGTGPFMFESYTPDSEVVLVRNPDYNWGSEEVFGRTGPADLDQLVFKLIEEPATRLAALESGEVDMIDAVPALDVARLDESDDFNVLQFPQAGHGYSLMFNFEKSPTDELAVRQAIAQAIDIDAMQEIVYEGLGTKACSALTNVMFAWTDVYCQQVPYDPEAAGQILDEAGWVMNEETGIRERDGVPLTIAHWSPSRPLNEATAQFIQQDLTAIGIDFQINLADVAAYLEVVRAGEHNTQQWWDTQTDPDGVFRTLFHSSNADGGTNRNRYRNEEMDMLIDEAVGIGDQEARAEVYAQIQQKIADEVIMAFFNDPVVLFAATPQVEGVTILGGGFIPNFYAASNGM
jgi:peptide/nickel transport system substrate-binding protein